MKADLQYASELARVAKQIAMGYAIKVSLPVRSESSIRITEIWTQKDLSCQGLSWTTREGNNSLLPSADGKNAVFTYILNTTLCIVVLKHIGNFVFYI